jgi:hypothetical protein
MKRWMFILPLAVGVAGLVSSAPQILQPYCGLAYYWLLVGTFFSAVIGAGGLLGFIRPSRQIMQLTAVLDPQGFREVLSGKTLAERRNANLLLLGTGLLLAIALPICLLHSRGSLSGDCTIFILCLSAVVAVLAIVQWRLWLVSSHITQPRMFIEPFPINRGVPLQIRVEAQVKKPIDRLHIRAWVLCTETSVLYLRRQNLALRKNVVEHIAAEQEQTHLDAGASVSLSHRMTISAGTPASGSAAVDGFPNYQWIFHLELKGTHQLLADFPLEVG